MDYGKTNRDVWEKDADGALCGEETCGCESMESTSPHVIRGCYGTLKAVVKQVESFPTRGGPQWQVGTQWTLAGRGLRVLRTLRGSGHLHDMGHTAYKCPVHPPMPKRKRTTGARTLRREIQLRFAITSSARLGAFCLETVAQWHA